ncbi:MAG: glucosyl-3-phosphoglycerate synthase [bacterium]
MSKYQLTQWFETHTFHSQDFSNLQTLLLLKQKRNLKISLCLPALNEEATIGNIISVLKTALYDEVRLVDEIVVIDSASSDRTRDIAKELGAKVYIHKDIMPVLGAYKGKGEALFKSLFVLQGDIVVWIDADIKNMDPRFVYGLVGPILRNQHILFTKGFYMRPIQSGNDIKPVGGGRVTELLARPLINAFYPELAGFIQPLAGEYAGFKNVFEQIPFPTGYGVEISMLISLLKLIGIDAMAQVDLEMRIHRNQRLTDLSKMSFGILQTFMKRLSEDKKIELLEKINTEYFQSLFSAGVSRIEKIALEEYERPPAVSFIKTDAMAKPVTHAKVSDDHGNFDIVVGIPSFNNADTIGHVLDAVTVGIEKYFPANRCAIINSDGGSNDGTPDIVKTFKEKNPNILSTTHPLFPVHKLSIPYTGIPGKGSAVRLIFEKAVEFKAKACVLVDADLRSITPEWVENLLGPVLYNGYDFVAPYYSRYKYDGTITNMIIYPITTALYGKALRQPIGGDFCISRKLLELYLDQPVWNTDIARFGIDIWLSTLAIAQGYNVCQSYLGTKIHRAKDPAIDLTNMFVQVVGTTFMLMETYKSVWRNVKEVSSVPLYGFVYETVPEPINVDVERMQKHFKEALSEMDTILKSILYDKTYNELMLLRQEREFPDPLWADVVYEFAYTFYKKKMERMSLLKAMVPLYLGKVASFVYRTLYSSPKQAEETVEGIVRSFVKQKEHLLEIWKE